MKTIKEKLKKKNNNKYIWITIPFITTFILKETSSKSKMEIYDLEKRVTHTLIETKGISQALFV